MLLHLIGAKELRSQRLLVAVETSGSIVPERREKSERLPDEHAVLRL
jgi:pyruvate-formate lyase-activating enzyme